MMQASTPNGDPTLTPYSFQTRLLAPKSFAPFGAARRSESVFDEAQNIRTHAHAQTRRPPQSPRLHLPECARHGFEYSDERDRDRDSEWGAS
ncbi:hypothetical protein AB1N83_013009 [Pleurotus pulmonarius]